jgi:hypothetical protein
LIQWSRAKGFEPRPLYSQRIDHPETNFPEPRILFANERENFRNGLESDGWRSVSALVHYGRFLLSIRLQNPFGPRVVEVGIKFVRRFEAIGDTAEDKLLLFVHRKAPAYIGPHLSKSAS